MGNESSRDGRPQIVALAIALVVMGINAITFAWRVSDPVVISDAWHFLGTVVRPYAMGELDIGDLFAKRTALDHSQPLNKLVTILNYEWFDLDYRVEAVAGALFACGALALLFALWRRTRTSSGESVTETMVMASVGAVYLSVGASAVYSWPLVTLGFLTHFFILGFAGIAWWVYSAPSPRAIAALFASTILIGIIADDVGYVAAAAIVLALAVIAIRNRGRWAAAAKVAATIVLGMVAYAWLYRLLSAAPPAPDSHSSSLGNLAGLALQPRQWWDMVWPPLSASIIHRGTLTQWVGPSAAALTGPLLAVVLLGCHAWFWVTAMNPRRKANALAFVAMVLMLMFYGLLAGLWATRISQFGAEYLWQPRYAVFYRWNLLALLLMLLARHAQSATASPLPGRLADGAMVAIAACLMVVQLPLAASAWKEVPYIVRYQEGEARQIIALAEGKPVNKCLPSLVVCRFPEDERMRLIAFLQRQRLNVFDPGLYGRLDIAPPARSEVAR